MNSSCIRHPENTRYIQLFDWQVAFCQGNHCAALLLAYFIAWHDWKCKHDQYYRRSNDIAEVHGDGRLHNENAYLFFSTEELIEGCMGLYGKKAVTDSIESLVKLAVISVHKNPNPRYYFDRTKYFKFYPNVCNAWIKENYAIQDVDSDDRAKTTDRKDKKEQLSRKSNRPLDENRQTITNTTNNTTNKNQSNNTHHDFVYQDDLKNVKNWAGDLI